MTETEGSDTDGAGTVDAAVVVDMGVVGTIKDSSNSNGFNRIWRERCVEWVGSLDICMGGCVLCKGF